MRKLMKKLYLSFIWFLSLRGMVESEYLTLTILHDIETREGQETAVKIFTDKGTTALFPLQTHTFSIKRGTDFYIEFSWFTPHTKVHHIETWHIKKFESRDKKKSFSLSLNPFLDQSKMIIDFHKIQGEKYLNQLFEFSFATFIHIEEKIKSEEVMPIYYTQEKSMEPMNDENTDTTTPSIQLDELDLKRKDSLTKIASFLDLSIHTPTFNPFK
ncbi:MAG: hypothetical protein US13_C0012G0023 [candidate division TM6 bacterium GW2011_GWE2_36_25]|nr:MAG: hypothetical protein US03_C0011G0015 [candidate division TM6 bacterium GW2011_GWF2_36_131]KKQ02645.1 MAG: hypothetical protein US13_C0012G0023 [candidate division TM6 bacterium GW2011_GWE2_36_25]KKQ17994.1 MAG: hypothetical protein US32_C0033G0007 [candidate division TM6 bacterium GW2011_GWA2_36_9]